MPEIYLGQWKWVTDKDGSYWQMPRADIGVSCLDLRSLPQCAKRETPEGYGLFALRKRDASVGYYLGDNLQKLVAAPFKQSLISALGIGESILASDPLGIILELYNHHADPTGQTRWKPLRGSRRNGVKLGFLNQAVWQDRFEANPIHLANTIAVFQADYRRNKAAGVPLMALQKWTGATMQALWGRMSDELTSQLLPLEYAKDGWTIPATTIGDTFVETNDTVLSSHTATGTGGGFAWTAVRNVFTVLGATDDVSVTTNAAGVEARAESALSSDGHYAQLDVTTLTDVALIGPGIRYAAAANTLYQCDIRDDTDKLEWGKKVANTFTHLGLSPIAYTPALPDTLKIQATIDDVITVYVDGVQKDSATDTSITGNLLTGIIGYRAGGAAKGDNFKAEDLAGVTFVPKIIFM